MSEEKIGMYTAEEIYEELANGFLHHSMVDAMYFKIKDLQQKVEQLEKQNKELLKKSYSDDVRMTKAVEFIKEEQQLTDIDEVINTDILLNILNKGDNE